MASLGKSLKFDEAEIDELSELKYGRPRTFAVLALLYPGLDLTRSFHEDHIFPKSRFTRSKLKKADIATDSIPDYIDRVDALPNLQLLEGMPNIEKQAQLPSEWLAGPHFTSSEARNNYVALNDLNDLPLDLGEFLAFFDGRKERIRTRLRVLLGAAAETQTQSDDAVVEPGDEDQDADDVDDIEDENEPVQSWSHEQIRDWVRSEFLLTAIDDFEKWLERTAGSSGDMRHHRGTRHAFHVKGRRVVAYTVAREWIHFWLPRRSAKDVDALGLLSQPESVHVNPNRAGISGRVASEQDLAILKDRVEPRIEAALADSDQRMSN